MHADGATPDEVVMAVRQVSRVLYACMRVWLCVLYVCMCVCVCVCGLQMWTHTVCWLQMWTRTGRGEWHSQEHTPGVDHITPHHTRVTSQSSARHSHIWLPMRS
jgi:hypothetical protein